MNLIIRPGACPAAVGLLCLALFPAGASPAGAAKEGEIHACARLAGLSAPLDVAARFESLPPAERRARITGVLEAEAEAVAGPVRAEFRQRGGSKLKLLWGAGVVCGEAPRAVWDRVADHPAVLGVFEDPVIPSSLLDDYAGGPNEGVLPEAPLVSLVVPEAWQRGFTGRGVVVALLDTGADLTHPDLAPRLWTNPGEIPGNSTDDDGNGFVDDVHGFNFNGNNGNVQDLAGHGTNVAGLLAGNGTAGKQTGVAPGLTMMVLRRGTTQEAMWAASQYAIENGADILTQSVSWKWSFVPKPDYAAWRRQAEAELAAGLIHTNSGGNNGDFLGTDPIPYNLAAPANSPPPWLPPAQTLRGGVSSVLAVGNVDALQLLVVSSSPYGPAEWTDIAARRDPTYPWGMPADLQDYPAFDGAMGLFKPDLVAPGDRSATTALGGGYTTFNGTSAATPRVAGILALMKQAVPGASPAELAEALVSTARDLGPVGPDNRLGYGMPRAMAAIEALGPPVRVAALAVSDPGAPRGDGDGGADAGEIDRVSVTIQNTSNASLGGIDLILTAVSGVVVRDPYLRVESLGAQASATPAETFGVEFAPGSCASTAELALEIRVGESARVERLFVRVGSETRTALFEDDMEQDRGWTRTGNATSGLFLRANPVGTVKNGQPGNPGSDHTPNPGVLAFVTGNGPTEPDADDVDDGATVITSPVIDASGFAEVELTFSRWFSNAGGSGEDRFLVEATGNGSSWTPLEQVTATDAFWRERKVVLSDLMTPGAATRLRVTVEDAGSNDMVEGGLDDLTLTGISYSCSPYSLPADPAPGAVGNTLLLAPAPGGHLQLTWSPPSSQGGTDPVRGYRVTRSATPSGGFAEIARPVALHHTLLDGMTAGPPGLTCFLVESLPNP